MERSICLEILEVYGVGPQIYQLLWTYWSWMRIAAKSGGYYGEACTDAQGMTQGDPLPPTIFNAVVDAVLLHWVSVMVEGVEERGGRG